MEIEYRLLSAAESSQYREMTFPAYRRLLDFRPTVLHPTELSEHKVWPIAVGAIRDGSPLGLVLGGLPMGEGGVPQLLSLFVARSVRRQGLGNELIQRFENAVRERGFDAVQAVYMTGKPGAAIFEHLLEQRHWSPPRRRMLVVRFSVGEAMGTPWYGKYELKPGSEVFEWTQLSSGDLEELKRSQQRSAWIPEDLVPWRYEVRTLEPRSSIGLRLDGEIVGWVLNHALTPETIRFTCAYIRPRLARRGRILPLFSESIRRLSDTPFVRCSFAVSVQQEEMLAFVEKWCVPWTAERVVESRGSVKVFVDDSKDEVKDAPQQNPS
jgi:GNAT superfamily N-acetyltransferase